MAWEGGGVSSLFLKVENGMGGWLWCSLKEGVSLFLEGRCSR